MADLTTFEVQGATTGLAFDPTTRILYGYSPGNQSIFAVDTGTDTVLYEIVNSGKYVLTGILGYDENYLYGCFPGDVHIYNKTTGLYITTVKTNTNAQSLIRTDDKLWIAAVLGSSSYIHRYSVVSGPTLTLDFYQSIAGQTWGGCLDKDGNFWVTAQYSTNPFYLYRMTSLQNLTTWDLTAFISISASAGPCYNPSDHTLIIGGQTQIIKWDIATETVVATLPLSAAGWNAQSFSRGIVDGYLHIYNGSNFYRIKADDLSIADTFPMSAYLPGETAYGPVYDEESCSLWAPRIHSTHQLGQYTVPCTSVEEYGDYQWSQCDFETYGTSGCDFEVYDPFVDPTFSVSPESPTTIVYPLPSDVEHWSAILHASQDAVFIKDKMRWVRVNLADGTTLTPSLNVNSTTQNRPVTTITPDGKVWSLGEHTVGVANPSVLRYDGVTGNFEASSGAFLGLHPYYYLAAHGTGQYHSFAADDFFYVLQSNLSTLERFANLGGGNYEIIGAGSSDKVGYVPSRNGDSLFVIPEVGDVVLHDLSASITSPFAAAYDPETHSVIIGQTTGTVIRWDIATETVVASGTFVGVLGKETDASFKRGPVGDVMWLGYQEYNINDLTPTGYFINPDLASPENAFTFGGMYDAGREGMWIVKGDSPTTPKVLVFVGRQIATVVSINCDFEPYAQGPCSDFEVY